MWDEFGHDYSPVEIISNKASITGQVWAGDAPGHFLSKNMFIIYHFKLNTIKYNRASSKLNFTHNSIHDQHHYYYHNNKMFIYKNYYVSTVI